MDEDVRRLIDDYARTDAKGRVNIILTHFKNFMSILEGLEEGLKFLIINERRMAKQRNSCDPGVRIQKSGISDPTAEMAIESVMLSELIRKGDISKEIGNIDNRDLYCREAETLRNMREDYHLVRSQIKTLPWNDYTVLKRYLMGNHDLDSLSCEIDCTYEAAKSRLRRAKKKVRNSTIFYLEKKYQGKGQTQ